MNYELIGLIVTIGIPLLTFLFTNNSSKFYLVIVDNINVYKEIKKNVDDLTITYKGNEVNERSYLLKAYIFYIGKKDVSKKNVFKKLSVELPESSTFHTYRLVYSSNDINIEAEIDNNKIDFDFDLFQSKDFFYFETFSEINEKKVSDTTYKIKGRIENVNELMVLPSELIDANKTHNILMTGFAFLFCACFSWFLQKIGDNSLTDQYSFTSVIVEKGSNKETSLPLIDIYNLEAGKRNKIISIFEKDVSKDYKTVYFLFNEATKLYKINEKSGVKFKLEKKENLYMGLFMGLMGLISFFALFLLIVYRFRIDYIIREIKKYKST